MKDDLVRAIRNQIQEQAIKIDFCGNTAENTLDYCELMLKHGAGYAVSYTEGLLLKSMINPKLVGANRKPTKMGMRFLCAVYYKHSNLQSDGCVWGSRYRRENK